MPVYDTRGGQNAHVDQVLTQISIAYPNNEFVGQEFFPQVPVNKQSDLYSVWGREDWVLEPGSDLRAPGAESYEIPGKKRSLSPYFAQEHSLQIAVTDEERENADAPLSPDRDGTELVTQKLLLGRELEMKTMLHTSGNYAAGLSTTLSGTSQWNDYANSVPVTNIKNGRRAVHAQLFREITKTMIPWQVLSILEDHPTFIDRIKYSQMGVLSKDIIGTIFGITNIVVPEVGYNSAAMGLTETLAYLWGKNVVMAYVPPRASMNIPAFGYEFVWKYGNGGQTQIVERWRENRRKSDIVRVSRRWDLKFTAVDGSGLSVAGYLIINAIA